MFQKIFLGFLCFFIFGCFDTSINAPVPSKKRSDLLPLRNLPKQTDCLAIAHAFIVDRDQDGWKDVLLCDVSAHQVSWSRDGKKQTFFSDIDGPVHAEAMDIDDDEDLDVLVATMGVILPSTAHAKKVIILENDGEQNFAHGVIAEHIWRVIDVQAGDLDGDGDLDLSVAQFGYTEGQVALGDRSSAIESFKVAIQFQPTFSQAKNALLKLEGR